MLPPQENTRRKRQMSVRKNSKGLWDADLYYKDFSGKLIKKRKINFKSKKEAQN